MTEQTLVSSAQINNRIDQSLIEDEFLNFLRVNLPDRQSRAEYQEETFTADGSSYYELVSDKDSKGRHKINCVKSLTVNGVEKKFIEDFIIGFRKESVILGTIQFWNPPTIGSTIRIKYYKRYSHVFTESTRYDLTTTNYPRISFSIFSMEPSDICIGGKVHSVDIKFKIRVVDNSQNGVLLIKQKVWDLFMDKSNKDGFHTVDYVREPRISQLIPFGEDPNDLIYMQEIDLVSPNQYQFSK